MGVFVAGVPSSLARRTPFFARSPSPSPFTPATQARGVPGFTDTPSGMPSRFVSKSRFVAFPMHFPTMKSTNKNKLASQLVAE